jgi:uncharacterized protein (TIGR01244 family)
MFHQLDARTMVSGQIRPEELAGIKARGIAMIVNNRPDGEEPGQPSGTEVEAAALAAGLDYRHVPVAGRLSDGQVEAMADALAAASGPVLAFCRSGTRSTFLWALARSRQGDPADEIMRKAAEAGYDLRPIEAYLRGS